jgi:hypothetical protein
MRTFFADLGSDSNAVAGPLPRSAPVLLFVEPVLYFQKPIQPFQIRGIKTAAGWNNLAGMDLF